MSDPKTDVVEKWRELLGERGLRIEPEKHPQTEQDFRGGEDYCPVNSSH